MKSRPPCVATVLEGGVSPRYPSVMGRMKAKKAPLQHWAGCASSKTILAINTDPDAPMMTKADYAVVGDMHEVLPALLAELA